MTNTLTAQIDSANAVACCQTGLLSKDPEHVLDAAGIRRRFPAILNNPEILFFDNSATTQKPAEVIDTIADFYRDQCANSGRAAYSWSTKLAARVDRTREVVARFINASANDVAFTSGATESLNLVATLWGLNNLQDGDEVMVCLEDHQSATLPWFNLQQLLERQGKSITVIPFKMHPSGTYDRKSISDNLSTRTRLIALTHVHHLYGMEMDLPELRKIIPERVLISLDASQSIGHTRVDVSQLGAHFISFSGHKMFAANGSGVLWVKPELRTQLWPVRVGAKSAAELTPDGLMIDRSTLSGMIECGTLNLPAILSLLPAIELIESVGSEQIEHHLSFLTHRLHESLKTLPLVKFAPGIGSCNCTKGYGILSFRLSGFDSADLAAYLDSLEIFVRTGDHCQLSRKGSDEFARVSLHVYNTLQEIERFVEVLSDAAS